MRKFKKWISLLLLCCLLLGVMPAARAANYAGLELVTGKSGSDWTVTVKLTGNKRPQMIEFCLEYSSSKIKLKSVKTGSAFSSANAPTYSTPKAGRVLFAWEALTGLKDGNLLVLTFTPKSGAKGTADIFFNEDYNTVFMDGDMEDIVVSLGRTDIDLDDWVSDDDDDDWNYNKPVPDNDNDDDDDWDDWDDDNDTEPVAEPTPIPLQTEEPYETPDPYAEEETEYAMPDMVIYVGQVCSTQEGFLFLSSDNEVVTIENGQLRGVSPGIATVTAYKDGSAVGACTITVEEDPAAQKTTGGGGSGSNVLKIVLWVGIALILAAVILIAVILIKRKREEEDQDLDY